MKKWRGATLLAIGVIGLLAGPAVAGHLASEVKSYTGCLVSKDGVIIRIKEGDAPSSPCGGGMVQVHFGGGDITAISAGTGLTGGGANGAVTLSLAAGFQLPQGCVTGEIAKWNGSGWECASDASASYSAGTGLDLIGTTFSIEADNLVVNGESCTAGQLVTGINSSGHITCAAPPAGGGLPHGWFKVGGFRIIGGTVEVLTLDLPAGAYFVTANLNIVNNDSDTGSQIDCWVGEEVSFIEVPAGDGREEFATVSGMVNHPGGGLVLKCHEHAADADVIGSSLYAIQLSGVN